MFDSPSRRMKIGDFLLRRLEEAGVRHLFGVPSNYNLELLQQLHDTGTLKWIGTCSELNASYAADGYARLNGLGALLVTNGVGALSAINGVGGSYSEHVPVVCIAGSIPLRSIDRSLGMHHTMADGTYDHFIDAYARVTAAHTQFTPRDTATKIDRLILTAWRESSRCTWSCHRTSRTSTSRLQQRRSCSRTPPAIRNGCARHRRDHKATVHGQGAGNPRECGCRPIQHRTRAHAAGREDAGSSGSRRRGQICDRRDVPALLWHLQRQGKRTPRTRGNQEQRLPARHRLPADRGDHGDFFASLPADAVHARGYQSTSAMTTIRRRRSGSPQGVIDAAPQVGTTLHVLSRLRWRAPTPAERTPTHPLSSLWLPMAGYARLPSGGRHPVRRQRHVIRSLRAEVPAEVHFHGFSNWRSSATRSEPCSAH